MRASFPSRLASILVVGLVLACGALVAKRCNSVGSEPAISFQYTDRSWNSEKVFNWNLPLTVAIGDADAGRELTADSPAYGAVRDEFCSGFRAATSADISDLETVWKSPVAKITFHQDSQPTIVLVRSGLFDIIFVRKMNEMNAFVHEHKSDDILYWRILRAIEQ